jgi:hypothetical protein
MARATEERAVVVTTEHRGVFVGYTKDRGATKEIALERARMVVYYSAETRSVLGIASRGVAKGSRVSPAVPRILLQNVTSVIDAAPEAVEAWEKEPWG